MSTLKKVNPDSIGKIPTQLRHASLKDTKTLELIYSILVQGLLQAPLCTLGKLDDGSVSQELIRVDGDRRLTAISFIKNYDLEKSLQENGVDSKGNDDLIKSIVKLLTAEKIAEFQKIKVAVSDEPMTIEEISVRQMSANLQQKATASREYLNMIYSLGSEGKTRREIAELIGISESRVGQLFKTIRLPEDVKEKAEKAEITTGHFIALAELKGKLGDEDAEWDEWLKKAKEISVAEFAIEVSDRASEIAEARRSNRKQAPQEFTPKMKLKKRAELEALYVDAEQKFSKDATPENEACLNLMKFIFSISEEEVAKQRQAFEKGVAEAKAKIEKRKKDREIAKAKEAVEKLKEAGIEI
jgi:DNA-directed RNA polymerase specialized sigma subunit